MDLPWEAQAPLRSRTGLAAPCFLFLRGLLLPAAGGFEGSCSLETTISAPTRAMERALVVVAEMRRKAQCSAV
jgi:hypothetical protein